MRVLICDDNVDAAETLRLVLDACCSSPSPALTKPADPAQVLRLVNAASTSRR
jgi:hypothetical protein